jgi:beta-1,4-N-acetylglucosaminyltransferase
MIFVTVGTYKFDKLIKAIDILALSLNHKFILQIGCGAYKPVNCEFYERLDRSDFSRLVSDAEIVITHAGAGTVYDLLESNKKIIVVPNLDRVDAHQIEIAEYVGKNDYGIYCTEVCNIEKSIFSCINRKAFFQYRRDLFFGAKIILDAAVNKIFIK